MVHPGRRSTLSPTSAEAPPWPVIAVVDPRAMAAAAQLARWNPELLVQSFSGAERAGELSVRASIAHGVAVLGLRTLWLCGEGPGSSGLGALLRGRDALRGEAELGPLLQASGVVVEVVWFDTAEGTIHRWSPTSGRLEPLTAASLLALRAEPFLRAPWSGPAIDA